MYIDKLDDIVSEYGNTYHSAIKMKPVDIKSSTCTDFDNNNNDDSNNNKEDPKFKVADQFSQKKFLWSERLKILICGDILLVILRVEKLLERFMKKNWRKQTKNNLE